MGIKHLWTVLTPYCEKKPLYELQGKTVAIDLSGWICEAQNITEYHVQPRMYLRNLYFRTCYLLLMETRLVFVLEGKAPTLKYDTIAARNAIQFKGARPKQDNVKTGKDRSRFDCILKRCEEMLGYMGLTCIKGNGEAESMCAYLNDEGLVDGCISQDSDCFAYGAKVVYRNFSISSQGPYAASGGSVDIYDITKPIENLDLGRNKMIVMALICGSDYNEGVQGIGKESILKFFERISDKDILDKIRSWRAQDNLYEQLEKQISDKSVCTSCGHLGKLQLHTKNGCTSCKTTKGCITSKFKEERQSIKNELNIRSKALEDPNFPDENLIKEFLTKKDSVSKLDLKWKQPDLISFVKFTTKYLQWDLIYSFQKLLPILSRWQCLNFDAIEHSALKGILHPSKIKKARSPKGIPSFEIIWSDPSEHYKDLIPHKLIEESNVDMEKLWSTIEPQILIEKAYPILVEEFKQSKMKPKKVSKRKKQDCNLIGNNSLTEPTTKKTRKGQKSKNKKDNFDDKMSELENSLQELNIKKSIKKINTLDNFLKKTIHDNDKNINTINTDVCHSTPLKINSEKNLYLDFSDFIENDDELDLSNIVEDIISHKPAYIEHKLKQINIDVVNFEQQNCYSFFITNPVDNDLFEQTFNMKDESSDENTEEYEFEQNDVEEAVSNDELGYKMLYDCEKENIDKDDDSFCGKYIPLLERLKNKLNRV